MRYLKTYKIFEMEGGDSLSIDDYIIQEDDIKDIFSDLYDDVPNLSKSEIYLYDCTNDDHPHIRQSINLEKGLSQFRVSFFMKKEDTSDPEWWDRFYQPTEKRFMKSNLDWPAKKLLHSDTLKHINNKMEQKFGYKLSKSAQLSYDDGIHTGQDNPQRKHGYRLDFYFTKI